MNILTHISNQVRVTVQVRYADDISDILKNEFTFAYIITLHNLSNRTMQVQKRHWKINDSMDKVRTVSGTGMNGVKAIISPNGTYEYEACVSIKSEFGRMGGFFNMLDMGTEKTFPVLVPDFVLMYPSKVN